MPFEKSFQRRLLEDRLIAAINNSEYDIIPYEALNKIIAGNVQGDDYPTMQAAKKGVERDKARLFMIVRGEGIKLMTAEEQASIPDASIDNVRRTTRRGLARMSRVEYDKLTQEQRRYHTTIASAMGAIDLIAKKKSVQIIDRHIKSPGPVDLTATLALFQKRDEERKKSMESE
jgi:hypothetical protein